MALAPCLTNKARVAAIPQIVEHKRAGSLLENQSVVGMYVAKFWIQLIAFRTRF
jgi:hypothetical protein